MRLVLIAALIALGGASVASATEQPAAATGAQAASVKAPEKTRKVCRRESPTGSTIPKRVCRTVVATADAPGTAGAKPAASEAAANR